MAKTMNTAEPMDETPEVLEEITPDLTEEPAIEEPAVEEPDVIEEPLPLEEVETEDAPGIMLEAASNTDESPLADIDPATRIEFFLDEIATGLAELVPATRIEEFLHRIAVRLNTIYNYEPIIPDPDNGDKDKVLTVVSSSGDYPAKWEGRYPVARLGSGTNSILITANVDKPLSYFENIDSSGPYSICAGIPYVSGATIVKLMATGSSSVALGIAAQATGSRSLAVGYRNVAEGESSVALGASNKASDTAPYGVALGYGNTANGRAATVIGQYATVDTAAESSVLGSHTRKYAFQIGNGTGSASASRSNALTVDWNGNVVASGAITSANIPAAPTADGTYKLTCTVSGGTPAYTWEAVTP